MRHAHSFLMLNVPNVSLIRLIYVHLYSRTPSVPCSHDSTDVPETVVDGSDTTTVLRMADLGKQKRTGSISDIRSHI